MKRLITGVLSGFLFLAATANGAYAEPCACGSHMAQGGMNEGMHRGQRMAGAGKGFIIRSQEGEHLLWRKLMRLDLSEKQKAALKEIKSREMKETIRKRADIEIVKVELSELLDKDSVDMGTVEAKLKKAEALRTELRFSHIKAREQVKAILTPEQRSKFKGDFGDAGMGTHCEKDMRFYKDADRKQEAKDGLDE